MKYVILGASAAGINAAKTLRKLDESAKITVISKDNKIYSRCMLHLYVGQKRDFDSLVFVEKNFFDKNRIHWIKNKTAIQLDSSNKTVILDDNTKVYYDKLLIATGSSASVPPVKNLKDGKNVFVLRDIEDAIAIDEKVKNSRSAVIIGGGLIGIDIAVELLHRGLKIYIIEMGENILPLQLDKRAAKTYEDELKRQGAKIFTGHLAKEAILDNNRNFSGIILDDQTKIKADMAVVAAGVKANANFIDGTKIKFDRGIVVDNRCQTDEDSIYAAGDVCAYKPGVWPLAVKQGIVAAYNMAGHKKVIGDVFGLKNSMNFFGIDTVSIGFANPKENKDYDITIYDDGYIYKKVISKNGIIHGAIFQNDISYSGVFTKLIKDKINIKSIRKDLLDIGYADFFEIAANGEFEYTL